MYFLKKKTNDVESMQYDVYMVRFPPFKFEFRFYFIDLTIQQTVNVN